MVCKSYCSAQDEVGYIKIPWNAPTYPPPPPPQVPRCPPTDACEICTRPALLYWMHMLLLHVCRSSAARRCLPPLRAPRHQETIPHLVLHTAFYAMTWSAAAFVTCPKLLMQAERVEGASSSSEDEGAAGSTSGSDGETGVEDRAVRQQARAKHRQRAVDARTRRAAASILDGALPGEC